MSAPLVAGRSRATRGEGALVVDLPSGAPTSVSVAGAQVHRRRDGLITLRMTPELADRLAAELKALGWVRRDWAWKAISEALFEVGGDDDKGSAA